MIDYKDLTFNFGDRRFMNMKTSPVIGFYR